jgi:hypothetical protein
MDFLLTQHINKIVDISGNIECDNNCANSEMDSYINHLNEIKKYKNSTTKRRAEFEALNLEKVNYVKSLLLIVYGLLVLWFIYVMYKNTDLKRQQKGLLVGGLVVFPFIAPVVLIYLYEMIAYILALMTGEIYKKAELQ